MSKDKVELTDEELNQVIGGTEYLRTHEIELGDFVVDAYKREEKKTGLNITNLTKFNNLKETNNIDNNFEPCQSNLNYKDKGVIYEPNNK